MSELERQFCDATGKTYVIIVSKEFRMVKIEIGNALPIVMDLTTFLKMAEAVKDYMK